MFFTLTRKKLIILTSALVCAVMLCAYFIKSPYSATSQDFIKWVDFNASYNAMNDALNADIDSKGAYSWIELLAYLSAKNGNNFSSYKKSELDAAIKRLSDGEKMEDMAKDLKYYNYYLEIYNAVLCEYVGWYHIQTENPVDEDEPLWEKRYGLKVFSPIAAGFSYSDYDDFANARSYGYKRRHTGHDLFGNIGTPVIAIEGGTVEAAGWNQYGGWRIGIRSFDKKRYYYYAHLRKDHPYAPCIKEGAVINAGDVIGYLGMTGYSTKENVNNINVPHLHMGIQLIFDESQKDGSTEIWIDTYRLMRIFEKNRQQTVKEDKEYVRKYNIYDLSD